jgi:hypothetical protein
MRMPMTVTRVHRSGEVNGPLGEMILEGVLSYMAERVDETVGDIPDA